MHSLSSIAALGYLLGAIPFGYLLVRIFRGEDVRLAGSGNIGATNVARKSPALGVVTLLLDALKGATAVWIAQRLYHDNAQTYFAMAIALLFAILGHMFPIWLKFHGGKGVATGMGGMAVLAPKSVLIAIVIFAAIVFAFRYVSLASIVAAATIPFIAFAFHEYSGNPYELAIIASASLLIILKHHENIRRLLHGKEHKFGKKPA